MPTRIVGPHERIVRLAAEVRSRFADVSNIDDVADRAGIVLVRTDGPMGKDAGFAHIEYVTEPAFIESLARPGALTRVWGRDERRAVRSIAINPNAGIPEREIFWHEYYHLFYSPHGVQRSERFEHRYSTEGVLHHQEERRADAFAAAVLVHPIDACGDVNNTIERFDVSERLARCAAQLAGQLTRFNNNVINNRLPLRVFEA